MSKQDALLRIQPELRGKSAAVAVVKPGREAVGSGEKVDVSSDEARVDVVVSLLHLRIMKPGLIEAGGIGKPVKIRHILIGGDRKMVLYNDLDQNEPVKVYDSGYQARSDEERSRLLFDYRAGDVYSPKISGGEALAALAADFVSAVSRGTAPVSDGRFGADVTAILEAAQRSVRQRGQEVELA